MNPVDFLTLEDPSFDDLTSCINEMLHIDTTNLDREQARTSSVFTYLYKILQVESRRLRDVMGLQEQLLVSRRKYYSGKATAAEYKAEPLNFTLMKTEIEQYINIDDKVRTIRSAVADADLRVKFVEDAIKVAKSRTYDIKNMLQWKQLTQS
jgi:hypothetical protein